jgi:hypothetical protein
MLWKNLIYGVLNLAIAEFRYRRARLDRLLLPQEAAFP